MYRFDRYLVFFLIIECQYKENVDQKISPNAWLEIK